MDMMCLARDRTAGAVAALVDALGTDDFETEALQFLNCTSGVEHYTVYRLRGSQPEFMGGASVRGPHAVRARKAEQHARDRAYHDLIAARSAASDAAGPVMMHNELQELEDRALRLAFNRFHIVDRVMLCGRRMDDVYAISLLRSAETGQFGGAELKRLAEVAETFIAACAKHAAIHWDRAKAIKGFESVEFIEGKLRRTDWGLSNRELQVAARILYGISAVGVALDLGLGEETIATYRKRLYQRLRIGSRHELLQKYLALV